MVHWMRDLVGLSDRWTGVLQDTASTATLVALICARERSSGYRGAHGGLQSVKAPLVVYASEQAHSSVEKAGVLAGFGRDHIRAIPTDGNFAMSTPALEQAIAEDRGRGLEPCCLVATTGTTGTTAMDPVATLVRIADREGLWMHVDSAMAGAAMLLPELRDHWDGIEAADSVVVNAHKWLGAVFDCSLYLVRDAGAPDPRDVRRTRATCVVPWIRRSSITGTGAFRSAAGFARSSFGSCCVAEGTGRLRARLRRDIENARPMVSRDDPRYRTLARRRAGGVADRLRPP